ncbi:hypothetical protein [Nodularia sp. UHCC 0506]|uniref:hypothetical protein n=1 Tax=Nodularia sp. UHCC 0506 TaxID=3110243 RepID=UPI002B1FA32F|nr:hypothetical protein [Nodularia sp. UHCC 0506]MEA5516424.1 hypothetical protein [Nodularia sp. UHCC 0506]
MSVSADENSFTSFWYFASIHPQNIIQRLTICISLYLRWQCGILHISNLELKYRYAGTLPDWM